MTPALDALRAILSELEKIERAKSRVTSVRFAWILKQARDGVRREDAYRAALKDARAKMGLES